MPQIYPKHTLPANADIYFWKIEENCEELSEMIANGRQLLAEARNRYKAPRRQLEWLATRVLLEQTPYKGEPILYHSNGQPYLPIEGVSISISHTTGYVAIAVSRQPVGIDIELKNRNALAAAAAFLQPQEIGKLAFAADQARKALQLWNIKEAAFKCHPERANVLKEITAEEKECCAAMETHHIKYKNGSCATCHSIELEEFILSVCGSE